MIFVYLFFTALAAVVAGMFLGMWQVGPLTKQVNDQLKTILELQTKLKQQTALADSRKLIIDQLERERV